ncbi:prolidase [Peniophora sp. CONT]|nr:prolidase [Peniophora sp. CONT]
MVYPAKKHALKTLQKLAELLPAEDKIKPQIILLVGEVTPYRNDTDRELPFRQESNFNYLTGCTVPGSSLLLSASSATSSELLTNTLFIPPIEPADLMWSVPPPTLDAAKESHDVPSVAHVTDLPKALADALSNANGALVHVLPLQTGKFPKISEDLITLSQSNPGSSLTDAFLLSALGKARIIKDDEEIERIRIANAISSRAHETVMRVLGQGVRGLIVDGRKDGKGGERPLLPGEWLIEKEAEAEAVFVASCRREGAVHQAYLPIVAASNRAATLHYCCNDREFAWGPVNAHDHKNRAQFAHATTDNRKLLPQVLLIDAGCEWDCYAADITRTMPVGNNGKFTPESRAIYSLVHEMQLAAFSALKPGLHWDAVQLLCHRTLVRGFQRLGIFKSPDSQGSGSWNSEEAILASGISAAFFPHGLGHSLGMDVHDVPEISKPGVNPSVEKGLELGHPSFYTYLRLRLPLEENMVVTVEPGCYFHQHLLAPVRDSKHIDHEVLKRYESVGGVRIEDVVVITKEGYENLTTVRSDVEWVEGVCSGEL